MYKELEKQLGAITSSLKSELSQAKAIDKDGRAIDVEKFNEIIDAKLERLYEFLETKTVKDGVTIDKYGANIIHAQIDSLAQMKKRGTISYATEWASNRQDPSDKQTAPTKSEKTRAFTRATEGFSRLFRQKQPTHQDPTNSR